MSHHHLTLAAIAVLFLTGCDRDVEYYQAHTDEAQAKLGECLKMDNPKEDNECNAAAAALNSTLSDRLSRYSNSIIPCFLYACWIDANRFSWRFSI